MTSQQNVTKPTKYIYYTSRQYKKNNAENTCLASRQNTLKLAKYVYYTSRQNGKDKQKNTFITFRKNKNNKNISKTHTRLICKTTTKLIKKNRLNYKTQKLSLLVKPNFLICPKLTPKNFTHLFIL